MLFNVKKSLCKIKEEIEVIENELQEIKEFSIKKVEEKLNEAFPNIKFNIYYSFEPTYEGSEIEYLDNFRIIIDSIDNFRYLSNGLVYKPIESYPNPYKVIIETPKVSFKDLKTLISKIEEELSIPIEIRVEDQKNIEKYVFK